MLSMLEILMPLLLVVLVVGPLMYLFSKGVSHTNARKRLLIQISVFSAVFILTAFYGTNR